MKRAVAIFVDNELAGVISEANYTQGNVEHIIQEHLDDFDLEINGELPKPDYVLGYNGIGLISDGETKPIPFEVQLTFVYS